MDGAAKTGAIICFVVSGASLAGTIAFAVTGNVGAAAAMILFTIVWGGFGLPIRRIGSGSRAAHRAAGASEVQAPPGAELPSQPADPEPWRARTDWAQSRIEQDRTRGPVFAERAA